MFGSKSLLAVALFLFTISTQLGTVEAAKEPGVEPASIVGGSRASAVISQTAPVQSVSILDISAILASLSSAVTAPPTSATDSASLLSSLSSQVSATPPVTSGTTAMATSIPASTSQSGAAGSSSTPLLNGNDSTATTTSATSLDNRTLTIILAIVLAIIGLVFLCVAFVIFRRYRRRQLCRGASPIDDEEIATWRGNSQAMGETSPSHVRSASSIVFQPSSGPERTVSGGPSSTTPPAAGDAKAAPLFSPPVVARAPNSRSGLTDEAKPGADPFVSLARRPSRRLSKAASASHMRNKSRRSSVSVSSVRERERPSTGAGQWCEPDDWAVLRGRADSRGGTTASTPPLSGRPSMGDEARQGGLSPRPTPNATANVLGHKIPGSAC